MHTEPHENHRWLAQLVGDWVMEGEGEMGPDQPPVKSHGTERVRMVGELWAIAEGEIEMPGAGTGLTRMTLGYDQQSGRFVGSWVGSMMSNLWVYDGQLDDARRVLTLDTTGPDFENPGQLKRYRDIIEIVSDSERLLRSELERSDGWVQFMSARYRRVEST